MRPLRNEKHKGRYVVWLVALILILWLVLVAVPKGASSFSSTEIGEKVGQGTTWTVKAIGKSCLGIAKGTYKVLEYFVQEAMRPLTPITEKMVDVFGVTVE